MPLLTFKQFGFIKTIMCVFLVFAMLPLHSAYAQEGTKTEIKLTPGNPIVHINGEPVEVEPPYLESGTTMVPLKIITKAFGAKLKLEKNKIITLTYGSKTVVVTIGSKAVKVNGKGMALTAAPKIVNNVTMVPLRVISQAFGAKLNISAQTKEITIEGTNAEQTPVGKVTEQINPDEGKTKVGDSYYGWTMKYPAGLAMVSQSDSGDWVRWADATEDAMVIVTLRDEPNELTREELRGKIEELYESNEYTIEKRSVTTGNLTFEKLVSRTRDGLYFEYRGIQSNEKLYIVIVGVNADSKAGLNKYQDMLDSFTPTFAKSDQSIKDIAKVIEGYMTVVDPDYGLTVSLPVNWHRDKESATPEFVSEDGYLALSISSLAAGDTADQWLERSKKQLEQDFAADYIRNIETKKIQMKDGVAHILKHEHTWNQKTWVTEYTVYLVVDGFRYQFEMIYNSENANEKERMFYTIFSSIDLDTEYIKRHFDEMEDEFDLIDRDTRVTKTSRKYGFSISLPAYWHSIKNDFEAGEILYASASGVFWIDIYEDKSQYTIQSRLKEAFSNQSEEGMEVVGSGTEQIAGRSADVITVDFNKTEDEKPYRLTMYIVENSGQAYVLSTVQYQATLTESNKQIMEETVKSFTFN
ncbi:stalk domain-containing protein [Paenibacillus tarimensis]